MIVKFRAKLFGQELLGFGQPNLIINIVLVRRTRTSGLESFFPYSADFWNFLFMKWDEWGTRRKIPSE